jgi:RNA polymerase subunit RPABC4/transcription elongation factor Spt4
MEIEIRNLKMPPETCPNCGADVPRNAKACPACGADEKTGWSDSAYASNLGIPEENFDYENFVKEEFGARQTRPRGVHWIWWLTALILVVLFLFFWFR